MIIARYPPAPGGAEIQCQRLSAALAAKGHEVTVLTENRSKSTPYEEIENGVRIIRMPTQGNPPWSSFVFILKLLKYMRRNPRFDVLHAHLIAMPAIFALAWGRWSRTPVLIKTAGAGPTGDIYTSRRLWRGRLKLRLFKRWVKSVIAPSRRARIELLDIGLKETQILRIPNGVDFNRFRPVSSEDRRLARIQLSLPADVPIAIYTGRWAHGKNIELLLDTWQAGLVHGQFRWKLLLVIGGDGVPASVKDRLEALKHDVFVFENIGDLLPFYHAADLAILLSSGEGLSNFLLEAMACGLPALTSESAAITGASTRDQWSWVIADSDLKPASLINFLMEKASPPDKLSNMGFAARHFVEEGFSLEAIAERYEQLYKSLVNHATI